MNVFCLVVQYDVYNIGFEIMFDAIINVMEPAMFHMI